jgi:putative methionine-R-sulfoxide reductase with GAF domain
MFDSSNQRLYTVASSGYATSGVGAEIRLGQGVIGVAARERTPVRIGHMTSAALYSQAMRHSFESNVPDFDPAIEIPYPGLAQPHSQVAVPILSSGRLLGVLFCESPQDLQFNWEDEDALVAMAGHLGAAIELVQAATEAAEAGAPAALPAPATRGAPLQLRRYASNGSVFINDIYLIKGVAGAILWKLAGDHVRLGRTEFSNRELRLDPSIGLPDISDNLEARLVLLQKRLLEQSPDLRIEKTGRGRFRLVVLRPLELVAA